MGHPARVDVRHPGAADWSLYSGHHSNSSSR
jgi:hypothetical protein